MAAGHGPGGRDADRIAENAWMERSDEVQPWLRGLDEHALAELAVDLSYAICRPSFGALTKRELEQTLFRLLYEYRRGDWTTLGEIADDLAITRTKARALVLEYRARVTGTMGRGERLKLLREEVLSWPRRHVGQFEGQLRIVVDDPFIRDLLKNFAYAHGILLDQSFSGEILTFGWDAYAQLLSGLYEQQGGLDSDTVRILGADLRAQVERAAALAKLDQALLDERLAKLDKEIENVLKTSGERRRQKLQELAKEWGPVIAEIMAKTILG